MIDAALFSYLAGNADLDPLLGGRIYPDRAPSSAAYPFLIYREIGSAHIHHQTAAAGLANVTMQLDVYDTDSHNASKVAEVLRLALQGMTTKAWGAGADAVNVKRVFLENRRKAFEPLEEGSQDGATKVSLDFTIWYAETIPTF